MRVRILAMALFLVPFTSAVAETAYEKMAARFAGGENTKTSDFKKDGVWIGECVYVTNADRVLTSGLYQFVKAGDLFFGEKPFADETPKTLAAKAVAELKKGGRIFLSDFDLRKEGYRMVNEATEKKMDDGIVTLVWRMCGFLLTGKVDSSVRDFFLRKRGEGILFRFEDYQEKTMKMSPSYSCAYDKFVELP